MSGKQSTSLEDILRSTDDSLNDIDIDSDGLDLQKKRYENKRYDQDTRTKGKLALWAAWIVSIYLAVVFFILIINKSHIQLSDGVLMMLLGTTTLNVLGLMYIVLKGYFKSA